MENNLSIEALNSISSEAISAIINLWNDEGKTFWRSTVHKNRPSEQESNNFFPTVSLRCLDSLLLTMKLCPDIISSNNKMIIEEKIIPRFLELNLTDLKSSLDDSKSDLNEFTLALYIQTYSRLCALLINDNDKFKLVQEKLETAILKLLDYPFLSGGNNVTEEHPFILFHIIQALTLSYSYLKQNTTQKKINDGLNIIFCNIKKVTEELFAKNELRTLNPSDKIALAFCAASLSSARLNENVQHLIPSLKISAESQDNFGHWPMGRVIHKDKDLDTQKLEISTYEVAWALGFACLKLIENEGINYYKNTVFDIMPNFVKSTEYAKKSIIKLEEEDIEILGWCSDLPYNYKMIESWTSANVLQFACILIQVKERIDVHEVLSTFSFICPNDRNWPDFIKWDRYKMDSEVCHNYPILDYLERKIINPIKIHPQNLPSPQNRTVSVLLFGPPGTSKTTIVKAVADGLTWPVVLLSPGNFIEGGLESIERLAK